MPNKVYHVQLSDEEYLQLHQYVQGGHKSARAITRARILLLADEHMSAEEIIDTLGVDRKTIYRVCKNYHEHGVEQALQEKARSGAPSKIDGRLEATLTMLACSTPPEGSARWTLQLLTDRLIELKAIDSISIETVRTILKKTNLNLGSSSAGA
jgi:putative transposase